MPAEYTATMMENNFVAWRARYTMPEQGPKDKTLMIHFRGDLSQLPWLYRTPQGIEVDFSILRSSAHGTFEYGWFPNEGTAAVQIETIGDEGNEFVMNIQL